MKKFIPLLIVVLTLVFSASSAQAAWIGGKWINKTPFKTFLNKSTYRRPFSATQKKVVLSDMRISKLPVDNKGIEVGATIHPNKTAWAYRNIVISHCEISDAWRSPGIHTDFIRIFGGGSNKQDVPTTVLLSDLYIHDGDAMPIIIQDGTFDKITLRDIRMERTAHSVQLVCINSGSMEDIYIVNCPGLKVSICGRPGSIKRVHVSNSPGAVVVDARNKAGLSGVKINYLK